jgi:hypothetical protein
MEDNTQSKKNLNNRVKLPPVSVKKTTMIELNNKSMQIHEESKLPLNSPNESVAFILNR